MFFRFNLKTIYVKTHTLEYKQIMKLPGTNIFSMVILVFFWQTLYFLSYFVIRNVHPIFTYNQFIFTFGYGGFKIGFLWNPPIDWIWYSCHWYFYLFLLIWILYFTIFSNYVVYSLLYFLFRCYVICIFFFFKILFWFFWLFFNSCVATLIF